VAVLDLVDDDGAVRILEQLHAAPVLVGGLIRASESAPSALPSEEAVSPRSGRSEAEDRAQRG
jgi:hypothetical protein